MAEEYYLKKLFLGDDEARYRYLKKYYCPQMALDIEFYNFVVYYDFEIRYGSEYECREIKTEKGKKRIYKSNIAEAGTIICVPASQSVISVLSDYDSYDTVVEVVGFPFNKKNVVDDNVEKRLKSCGRSKYAVILYDENKKAGSTDIISANPLAEAKKSLENKGISVEIVNGKEQESRVLEHFMSFSEKIKKEYEVKYTSSKLIFDNLFDSPLYVTKYPKIIDYLWLPSVGAVFSKAMSMAGRNHFVRRGSYNTDLFLWDLYCEVYLDMLKENDYKILKDFLRELLEEILFNELLDENKISYIINDIINDAVFGTYKNSFKRLTEKNPCGNLRFKIPSSSGDHDTFFQYVENVNKDDRFLSQFKEKTECFFKDGVKYCFKKHIESKYNEIKTNLGKGV